MKLLVHTSYITPASAPPNTDNCIALSGNDFSHIAALCVFGPTPNSFTVNPLLSRIFLILFTNALSFDVVNMLSVDITTNLDLTFVGFILFQLYILHDDGRYFEVDTSIILVYVYTML